MRAAYEQSADRRERMIGRRALAMALAIGFELLIVIALLTVSWQQASERKPDSALKTFSLNASTDTARSATPRPRSRASSDARRPPPPSLPPPPPVKAPAKLLAMSSDEFAASDISKIRPSRSDGAESAAGADSAAAYGPGEGPGGARLYNAEWYREPTRGELAFYLPKGMSEGWALIACRTIAGYRVDNCQALGESPPGSGLARGLREAAWQFRVLPPRIDGKPIIGAWVRIRFDFTTGIAK